MANNKVWKEPFQRYGSVQGDKIVGPLSVAMFNPDHTPDNKAGGLVDSQATVTFTCGKPERSPMWLEIEISETTTSRRRITRTITESLSQELARKLYDFLGEQLKAAGEVL